MDLQFWAKTLLDRYINVNHTHLSKKSRCWWYRKYAPGDIDLAYLNSPTLHVRVRQMAVE